MERQRGRIELIMGCMFAGKTTELLRRCNKHNITGKKVLRVKFSADKRYGADFSISTHSGQKQTAKPINVLADLNEEWKEFDVIGIDEGQFFTDIVEFSEKASNSGKVVIISSLQGTFLRGAFPCILQLIPKCEKIKKLTAICKLCKQNASFTFRTASKDCHTMIGGENMYMPLCRECHARESQLNQDNTFIGDPSKISVEFENKQFEKPAVNLSVSTTTPENKNGAPNSALKTPASYATGTTTASTDSPKAKSFTSSEDDLDRHNEITLRRKNL